MKDLKSQILSEVESELGSGAVMVVSDAMEKCETLSKVVELCEKAGISNSIRQSVEIGRLIKE